MFLLNHFEESWGIFLWKPVSDTDKKKKKGHSNFSSHKSDFFLRIAWYKLQVDESASFYLEVWTSFHIFSEIWICIYKVQFWGEMRLANELRDKELQLWEKSLDLAILTLFLRFVALFLRIASLYHVILFFFNNCEFISCNSNFISQICNFISQTSEFLSCNSDFRIRKILRKISELWEKTSEFWDKKLQLAPLIEWRKQASKYFWTRPAVFNILHLNSCDNPILELLIWEFIIGTIKK